MSESLEYFHEAMDDLADSTKKQYEGALSEFLEWMGMTSDEVFKAHLKAYQSKNPRDMMKMPRKLKEFQEHLTEQRMAPISTLKYYNAVKKFFTGNALPFNGKTLKGSTEGWPYISHEEIKLMVETTGNGMLRAAIMFDKEAALRPGDLLSLPTSLIQPALDDPELEWFTFEWTQEKTGRTAYPVVGPEGLEHLRRWYEERQRRGIPCGPDTAVFCKVRGERGGHVTVNSMSACFDYTRKKTKIADKENVPVFHSLRKFQKTNLEAALVPISWINVFQGRKGQGSPKQDPQAQGSGQVYTKPPEEMRIEMFKRGYDRLRIYGSSKNLEKKLEDAEKERRVLASTLFKAMMSDNPRQVLISEGMDPDELMEMLRTDRAGFTDELMRRLQKE